jgi:hypothetical protein
MDIPGMGIGDSRGSLQDMADPSTFGVFADAAPGRGS